MFAVGRVTVAVASAVGLATVLAAPVTADPSSPLTQAVLDARAAAPCGALTYDPTVEHAADIVNRSTFDYLGHDAENVPADGPHPVAIAQDLGIDTAKASSFQGAGRDQESAIKGVLLQGRNAFLDCTYTDFGVSMLYEPQSGYELAGVVMVAK